MDDLFGVTELVKQMEDEEGANSIAENERDRNEKDRADHIEPVMGKTEAGANVVGSRFG